MPSIKESYDYERGYLNGYKEGLSKGMEQALKAEQLRGTRVLAIGNEDSSKLKKIIEESRRDPVGIMAILI